MEFVYGGLSVRARIISEEMDSKGEFLGECFLDEAMIAEDNQFFSGLQEIFDPFNGCV